MIRQILLLFLFSLVLITITFSQQYHAVLITGACPWYEGRIWNEMFWNDTFLMWETLKNHGYDSNNIHVLYYDGADYQSPYSRYTPPAGVTVTTAAATSANLQSTFTTLANTMTNNDVLLIWTFGHGGTHYNNVSLLELLNGEILDSDFADMINVIPCKKRIILMAQCYGGGFIDNLQNNKTVMLTACGADEMAQTADDINPDGTDEAENEIHWSVIKTYHSEFNYHVINAIRGSTLYEGSDASSDLDHNSGVSLNEAKECEFERDSYTSYHPMYSDPGSLGGETFFNRVMDLASQNISTSSAAVVGNNQRKLFRETSGTIHEVFESENEVFYHRWPVGNQSWDVITRLSPSSGGSNAPCVTIAGSTILVIYQRLTGGSYSIEVSRSTNGGSSWSSLPSLGSYSCDSPGPMPTISALGNSVFAAYRTFSGGMMWNRSMDGGATWNAAGTVPGTGASCNSASSIMYYTYWTVPQANLAYATDIPTGSPRIYYKWYDFDAGSWGSTIDLTAIVPGNLSHHANPCIAVAPNTSGGRDVHTAWDAALDAPPTRVIVHRKNPFRSSGSVYNVLGDYGWTKPTISCVGENLLWMLCQNSSSGAIWRRYYNGTTWGAGTTVPGGGRDPQLSVQFGGTTASAKYLYTTGSQSPFPVVLGSETLSKSTGNVVYTRALNVIDSASRASVTMELGVPQIETKSGARIPIDFTWDINDSVKFDLAMLLNSGATEGFTVPTDAASLILPVAIYGKDPSMVFGNNIGTLEVGVTNLREGTKLTTIGKTLSTAVSEQSREPSEIRLPLNGALTGAAPMKLVPTIAGIRTDRNLIFSLGHIYRTVGADSLGKGIQVATADPVPNDYALTQNYPNPFNPTTQIRFAMPSGGNVSLVVYDVLGREIAILSNGFRGAGYHTATWNASSVASGVYFARLTVTDESGQMKFSKITKLVLAK